MTISTKPILVTGASSFVGIHVIIQLLEQGYNVRGTIRSLSKEA
ncbi:MAG: NAD-dependent epimerase/dehydratase family protein, partial [Chloroflexota bacterium]